MGQALPRRVSVTWCLPGIPLSVPPGLPGPSPGTGLAEGSSLDQLLERQLEGTFSPSMGAVSLSLDPPSIQLRKNKGDR